MPAMSPTARLLLVLSLSVTLGLAVGSDQLVAAQQAEDSRDAAIRLVAARAAVPPQRLTAVTIADATFPALGTVGVAVKVLDTATGVTYTVTLDRNRQPFDTAQMLSSDRALQSARGAPLEPSLSGRLADTPGDQSVPVVFWLREPAWIRPGTASAAAHRRGGPDQDAARTLDAALAASRAAVVRPLVTSLVSRLGAAGIAGLTAGARRWSTRACPRSWLPS